MLQAIRVMEMDVVGGAAESSLDRELFPAGIHARVNSQSVIIGFESENVLRQGGVHGGGRASQPGVATSPELLRLWSMHELWIDIRLSTVARLVRREIFGQAF